MNQNENIVHFDVAIKTFPEFPGYIGNPPQNELQYQNIEWMNSWNSPSWAEVTVAINDSIKNISKLKAKQLIAATDWAVLPDVGLKNAAEFVTYRGILRGLIITPVADPAWPTEPTPIWE